MAESIIEEATRLGVEEVAICECGTAYRVMRHMTGEHPFRVVSFVELMERYLQEGRIRVDPKKVEGRVTYHDPCQIARSTQLPALKTSPLAALADRWSSSTVDALNPRLLLGTSSSGRSLP